VGMQLINEVIRDVFRRGPMERVPTYLFIDEAGLFCTPEIGEILDRGAGYQLRLILGHQNLSQFIGPDGDRRILGSVLGGTWLKIVFGGLAPRDADEIGALLFGHRLDPDRKQFVQTSLRQLQHVVRSRSRTRGTSEAETISSGTSRTHAEGESEGWT